MSRVEYVEEIDDRPKGIEYFSHGLLPKGGKYQHFTLYVRFEDNREFARHYSIKRDLKSVETWFEVKIEE